MPNQILQVDENMLETKLDRLVSEKVEQLLNAMLDAEADEITGAARYDVFSQVGVSVFVGYFLRFWAWVCRPGVFIGFGVCRT